MNIGYAIKHLRRRYKLSQTEMAERIGVTQTHLSLVENGERGTSQTLLDRICYEFKIPMAILLWSTLDINQVQPSKRESYKLLKPAVDSLVEQFFTDETYGK